MRSLRRLLALALSALMLSALPVMGAAAAGSGFTDSDQIARTEAVEVMTALGVFQGNESGAFDPDGILTREQAAKIICCMLNARQEAEALRTDGYLFDDVAPARWSAPYIAFCVERGILSGDGSGKFYPEQALTGAAFAKMLLVALNYDPEIEGFTGSDWLLNVASMAVSLGVAPNELNLMDNLNRQDAAQMCYNTLTQDLVRYKSVNEIYTNRPSVGKVEGYYSGDYDGSRDGIQQFCEAYFPTLKLETVYDDFARPVKCWTYDSDAIHYRALAPAAVLSGAVSAGEAASLLKGFTLQDRTLYAANKPISDSVQVSFNATVNLSFVGLGTNVSQSSRRIEGQSTAAFLAGLTGSGRQVEIYADEKNVITDLVVITYSVGTLTAINSAPGKTAYTVGGVSYLDDLSDLSADTVVLHGTVRAGDTVTYTVTRGVAHIYPTTQLEGVLTQLDGGYAVISGERYPVGTSVAGAAELTCSAEPQSFCLDQFGNVVDVRAGVRSSGYARVVSAAGSYTPADEAENLPASGPVLTVTAVDAAGSMGRYTVALHTLTAADVAEGGPYAQFGSQGADSVNNPAGVAAGGAGYVSASSVRLEAGDVVVRNTSILVYDLSADGGDNGANSPQSVGAAAAALTTAWAYVLEGDVITLQPLSAPSDHMGAYTTYLAAGLDLEDLGTVSVTEEGCILTVDSNTAYVIYDAASGQAVRYQGTSNLPPDTALDAADVLVMAYGSNLGNSVLVFASK